MIYIVHVHSYLKVSRTEILTHYRVNILCTKEEKAFKEKMYLMAALFIKNTQMLEKKQQRNQSIVEEVLQELTFRYWSQC